MFFPEVVGFGIHFKAVLLISAENGDVEVLLVDMHHFGEEFPSVGNGFFLEVITERPVAEHLEHGVVICIVSHLFQVVVLAAYTQAFLSITDTGIWSIGIAKEDVLELVHAGVGEHQRGVVLHHHGGTGHNVVSFILEVL